MNATKTKFESDLDEYRKMGGCVDSLRQIDGESAEKYAVDFQYLMMNRWAYDVAIRVLGYSENKELCDFASKVDFCAFMASHFPVRHYDIREPDFSVPGLQFVRGDITDLGIGNNSVDVASCLHVAEHIGLGRYGDKIDPQGFEKACKELHRVIKPGGNLIFAVPVGKPAVVFNAHRVIDTRRVLAQFDEMTLIEHSGISSDGRFIKDCPTGALDSDAYGCGLFHFVKGVR